MSSVALKSLSAAADSAVALVRLSEASYHYPNGQMALNSVSLSIGRGDKLVIVGANGSGKSTLMRILAALIFPTSGRLDAFGREVTERGMRNPADAAWFRGRVALVFQNADAQLFSPTVREDLEFGPLQLGLERDNVIKRVNDTAHLLDIVHLLDRAPYQLSAGEKRRVSLATALTMNPEVILLDEPTAGLDPRSRGKVVELLMRLHESGKTIVTCTHDLEIVNVLAERVIVLNEEHGIEADGPAEQILKNSDMLASVNLIHEHLHRHGDLWHSHAHHHGGNHDHTHDK